MDTSETFKELQELRRGRGLHAEDLDTRIGSRLRRACGVDDTDTAAVVRRKVTLRMTELCGRLPHDLRLAVLAALALHQDASHRFLHERMAWLAARFDRDPRTARRRVDAGLMLLAEYLHDGGHPRQDADNPYAPDGWYVESLRAVLRMDVDPPTLLEERCIVAIMDDLDEIVVSLSAPRDERIQNKEDRITCEIVYGGEIVEDHPTTTGHTRFIIRLPQPLSLGQRHEYGIQFTSYPRSRMRPYYVITPLRRCDHFTARIHFGSIFTPDLIWRVSGVPPRALDDFEPIDDFLAISRVGDVSVEFHDLKQGLSYGVQWRR